MVGVEVMKLYKDKKNKVHAFELDGSQDHLITKGMTKVTQGKADKIIAAEQEAAYKAMTYHEKRRQKYPDIGDQLDAIMKWVAGENEITVTPELKSIAMQCMAVKSKYPKPKE